MELFLVAFAIVAITLICFKSIKMFNYLDNMAGIMEMIPGPTPYPFVGNLFQFGLKPEEYTRKILQYCRKYDFQGYRSLVFFQYHIMLSDPAEIQSILSSSLLVHKEHLYSFLRPWLGDGLLTSSGAQWFKHQQLYLPAFDKNAIEGYMHVVNKTGIKLVQKLQAYAKNEEMFDVQSLVQMCTLDIVSENATGTPSNLLDNQPSELNKAVIVLCDVVQDRTFSIVKRFDTLFRLTPYYGKQRRALDSLKSEINQIAGQIKCETQCDSSSDGKMQNLYPASSSETEFKPFINVLLNAKLDGRKLKSNEIIEELSTFIFTGHDPVAAALSFTLYTLSRHPAIQLKVYEEQQNVFNTKSGDELRSVNVKTGHLNDMTYLEMVLRETLRLYPAVPLIARTNREPIDINGTKITNSTIIILCLIAMGYNDKYFEKPCEFRPERFDSKSNEAILGTNALKCVPFSAGPRKCLAEKFAMYELKSLLARLIRHYEILPAAEGLASGINDHSQQDCQPQSEYDPILNIRVTLKSENGILIRLKERK